MRVMLADAGLAIDGLTPSERLLGSLGSAFVGLAEALAAEGAEVHAFAKDARKIIHRGVHWAPAGKDYPKTVDLLIANRSPRPLAAPVTARRRILWLHTPAQFLSKPRYFLPLLRHSAVLVFSGAAHMKTAPVWIPGKRVIVPMGVDAAFVETPRLSGPPPPRAVFSANPTRALGALLLLWRERIRPAAPDAELHVFSAPHAHAAEGPRAAAMRASLADAASLGDHGVRVHEPRPKAALAKVLGQARVLLYFGDAGETNCLSVAEALAMGVPAVVRPVGAVSEQVRHGRTGFVEEDYAAFADATTRVLSDDALWTSLSTAALAERDRLSWSKAAHAFAALAQ